jgi:dephospho-CoA kinase
MPRSKHKPVIGLMGGIGSGKSFIARLMAQEGCAVIDADQIARDALKEPAVIAQLVQWWGPAVLDAQGQIDRRAVAGIVFQNEVERRKLENLVHPEVGRRRALLHQQHQADPAVRAIVEDCPLLVESGIDRECDVLVYVASSPENRLRRVQSQRGWDAQELDRRQKSQLGLDIKQKLADYVVDNDADSVQSLLQVRRVLSQIFQHEPGEMGPVE